jgi:hypothetical protein
MKRKFWLLLNLHDVDLWFTYLLGQCFQIKIDHQSLKILWNNEFPPHRNKNGSPGSLAMIIR